MTKTEYLNQYQDLKAVIAILKLEIDELKTHSQSLKAIAYDGVRVQTTPERDKIALAVDKILKFEQIAAKKIIEAIHIREAIQTAINDIKNSQFRARIIYIISFLMAVRK